MRTAEYRPYSRDVRDKASEGRSLRHSNTADVSQSGHSFCPVMTPECAERGPSLQIEPTAAIWTKPPLRKMAETGSGSLSVPLDRSAPMDRANAADSDWLSLCGGYSLGFNKMGEAQKQGRQQMRRYVLASACAIALTVSCAPANAQDAKPNILVIFGDDIGQTNVSASWATGPRTSTPSPRTA